MKKIVFWLAFIVGIIAVIGACSKSEDDSSTAATTSCAGVTGWTEATSCSGTASGSITGIDNLTFSGSYSKPVYPSSMISSKAVSFEAITALPIAIASNGLRGVTKRVTLVSGRLTTNMSIKS